MKGNNKMIKLIGIMKNLSLKKKESFSTFFFILFIFLGIGLIGCNDEPQLRDRGNEELVITEYIIREKDLFSEFNGVLEKTGIDNILRLRGPYTLMAPTNDAMFAYYTSKGVSSYNEIETEELKNFVLNHIFKGSIGTGAIGLGALPFKNGLNDYIASDLQETEIILNKKAKIIKRDIEVSNGFIHHIDKVLEPFDDDDHIFAVLSALEGYSIFTEGLVRAGISDTLNDISFPYGNTTAKVNFTLLAVPDTLYQREGINSINDLIDRYGTEGELSDTSNGFYKYMIFHCVSGINYFSLLDTDSKGKAYYLITNDNYIHITVGKDYFINKDTDGNYSAFYYEQSNIPAKNGVIHTINNLFPNVEMAPVQITFQTTDFFDLQQGDYYLDHYARFYDGENTFEGIKWDAEYLMYYFKYETLMDHDALSLMGHFWIEITTPKIRKGTYNLSTFMFWGSGNAYTAWYVDGEYLGDLDPGLGIWGDITHPVVVGEVTFTETKTHTIRLQTLIPGGMWWDFIRFEPK